jgi:hypothetical protein
MHYFFCCTWLRNVVHTHTHTHTHTKCTHMTHACPQVVKCQTEDNEHYAIKIIRNKPAYTNQALVENLILNMVLCHALPCHAMPCTAILHFLHRPFPSGGISTHHALLLQVNKDNNSHVLKYYECFTHKNHLCLVSELRQSFSSPLSHTRFPQ